jgi:hypothetical protein
MANDHETAIWRSKDGRRWRIGRHAEIAWIEENTESGLTIMSAIPPVFEAYATLEEPGTGNHELTASSAEDWKRRERDWERHEAGVLEVLAAHTAPQPWWLGYLETGAHDVVFASAPRVRFYADWPYVLVEAGPEQAGTWRDGIPDLMFSADRSWLFSTLWDDDWTCIGGSRELVDAFLAHPDLQPRVREVDPSVKDATPPGHTAF